MKNLIYAFVATLFFLGAASCSKKEEQRQKWEYKTLVTEGLSFSKFSPKTIMIPNDKLDSLGMEGWELVDIYTAIETVHPNFGNDKYVTGLQPNTRTGDVYYVFKRPIVEGDTVKSASVEFENLNTPRVSEGTNDTLAS